jgi:hypothetical protein
MATKHPVTVTTNPPKSRPNSVQRRQALYAELATKQQDLKREAQQRRTERAERSTRTD